MGIIKEAKNQLFDRAMAAGFKIGDKPNSVHTTDRQIGSVIDSSVIRGEVTLDIRGDIFIYRGRNVADLDTFLQEDAKTSRKFIGKINQIPTNLSKKG